MHGLADYEFLQERYTRMRREAETARLAKKLRANRKAQPDLARTLRWELSRYAGLLGKRLATTAEASGNEDAGRRGKRPPRPTEKRENEMYGSVAQQIKREHHENLRREAARVNPAPMAHANRETTPHVARDLSWELARFLDADDFPTGAFEARDGANENPPRPE